MDRDRRKDIFEAAGMLSIIASLIFVGLLVRQDQNIARSQLFSDGIALLDELHQAFQEPAVTSAYAKMLDSPDDLSTEELIHLDRLLERVAIIYARECYLVGRGIFAECENIVKITAELYFGNPHAQSWWRLHGPRNILPDWIDADIRGLDADSYRRRIEDARAGSQ